MKELSNKSRIFGLDLMRALAIVMVIAGHCTWIFPPSRSTVAKLMAMSGYLGVEIFFVLSGFLIGKILYRHFLETDFGFKTVLFFLKRRWFRTLPTYFLILLVNIVIAAFIGYKIEGLWRYFFFLQNFASPMLPFFTESWSLSVEEFAYLLLPFFLLAILFIFRQKGRSQLFLYAAIFLILFFMGRKWLFHFNQADLSMGEWSAGIKSVVTYRLDAIFIGVLFSWIHSNYAQFWKNISQVSAVLGFIMLLLITFGTGKLGIFRDNQEFFRNVLYLPFTSLACAFFLPLLSEWKTEKSFLRNPVTFISLISYSIYLVHYGIVLQLMKYFITVPAEDFIGLLGFTVLYLLITIFLSYWLYRFYEKPMTDLRQKTL